MVRLTNATSAITGFLFSVVLMTSCSIAKDEKAASSKDTAQTVAETKVDDNAITPSFDCAKAKTEVEKLICSDPELARLDREMADKYNAMYQQMRKENPDLDQYNQDYPKLFARRQKRWIEIRNKLKNIDALKKAYNEQIGVIESYEYLKGCYKSIRYSNDFSLDSMIDFSDSIIDISLCDEFERYHWGYSILYSLLDPQERQASIHKEIKEKEKMKIEYKEKYSRKKWKEIDDLYKKNPKEANRYLANKLKENARFSFEISEIFKPKIDSFFSDACDFYVASERYGGFRGAGVHSIRYKEQDGKYWLHYIGLAHSCAFYIYEKVGNKPNAPSVSVKTPAMKGECYPHEPPVVYKGNQYIKLSAKDVTDNLHGAKYALYRFDQKSVSFIYDCSIKE